MAALVFSFDTLKTGGHFLCKFYQGTEEKAFENKLKRLFAKVSREKPDSSRTVCWSWNSRGLPTDSL
jgi:21S rRNA (uridine2791-2'-O)-methyltransferase